MGKRVLVGILGLMASRGAGAAEDVPEGSTVQLTGVGRQDAFRKDRDNLVGQTCVVGAEGMHHNGRGWWGGSMTCEDGAYYYFYQSSFDVLSGPAAAPAVPTVYDAVLTGGASISVISAPSSFGTPSAWPVGARVKIAEISSADTYYAERASILGKSCTVSDADLTGSGDWQEGQVRCDDGSRYYFYAARFTAAPASATSPVTPSATTPSPAASAPTGDGVPAGRLVKVTDIGSQDALYASRTSLVGRTCSVIEAPLVPMGEGFYAGRLLCDDGKQYQFFRVEVAP